jgi:hypothetical protein
MTIILPGVLYVCEACSLALREEHRLRVFENRVQRRIFRPRREEVMGGLRKLHKEDLRDFNSWPRKIRIIRSKKRWAGHAVRMGEKRNASRLLLESQREKDQ